MPPKNKPPSSPAHPDQATNLDLSAQLEALTQLVNSYTARFDKLEGLLTEVRRENTTLKASLADRDKEILRLSKKVNAQEQYNRSWSIRILNLHISKEDSTSNSTVMNKVYENVLLPILQGAVAKKLIPSIPPVEQLLETAHILPSKPGSPNPIIARFFTQNLWALMFRIKHDHAPRLPAGNAAGRSSGNLKQRESGPYKYPFYEDLTKLNFAKLRAIAQHERVQACWSVSGILRYKLTNDSTIFKVSDVFDTVEEILKQSKKV